MMVLKLLKYPALSCDIETFSLKHFSAGIGTITFCWNQEEGIAFPVDFLGEAERAEVREMLREFFEAYEGTMLYHNISYDVYVLIYQLFMEHILDQEGLLYGLEVMLKNWHDTKLITYLATNSCSGNKLSLKDQAQEYAGNYAQEASRRMYSNCWMSGSCSIRRMASSLSAWRIGLTSFTRSMSTGRPVNCIWIISIIAGLKIVL